MGVAAAISSLRWSPRTGGQRRRCTGTGSSGKGGEMENQILHYMSVVLSQRVGVFCYKLFYRLWICIRYFKTKIFRITDILRLKYLSDWVFDLTVILNMGYTVTQYSHKTGILPQCQKKKSKCNGYFTHWNFTIKYFCKTGILPQHNLINIYFDIQKFRR